MINSTPSTAKVIMRVWLQPGTLFVYKNCLVSKQNSAFSTLYSVVKVIILKEEHNKNVRF